MLPLIRLPECPHCGTADQGTRAKGGNSVRCSGCGVMRRVPMYRRTYGDDDPRATRPVRGRPLPPGHPYRFQPGNRAYAPARPASAPHTGSPSARPGKSGKPASGMDTLKELITRLAKNPETVLQLTTEVGDGSDCMEVVRLAEVFDNKYPKFGLYWEASKNWKLVKFWIDRSEYTAPAPKFREPRANLAQPPRRMPNQTRPTVAPAPKPTYVNPDTCAHPGLSYDHMADAYRCPDCSYARPAWT